MCSLGKKHFTGAKYFLAFLKTLMIINQIKKCLTPKRKIHMLLEEHASFTTQNIERRCNENNWFTSWTYCNWACVKNPYQYVNVQYCLTFSPVMAKGALNHCSKELHDLKMLGSRKFSRAHNSGSLFCNIIYLPVLHSITQYNSHLI